MIEIAELDSMRRADVGRIKAFMSRPTDRFRPPYGKHPIPCPRQCVFAGSVNHLAYLRDETGGRRFWPATCTSIDIRKLEQARDQLWAEANYRFEAGDTWWLDSIELNEESAIEQAQRYQGDPWDAEIAAWLRSRDPASVSVSEALKDCLGKKVDQWNQSDENRVARSLTSLGCGGIVDLEKHASGDTSRRANKRVPVVPSCRPRCSIFRLVFQWCVPLVVPLETLCYVLRVPVFH